MAFHDILIYRGECEEVMLRDSETNERIPLKYPGTTLVGRGKVCEIQPNSTSISKKHAQIEVLVDPSTNTMKEIWIEDLGSRNGTFTGTPDNWKIINETRRRIKVGDHIKFGLSVTYYRLERKDDDFGEVGRKSEGMSASLQDYEPQTLAVRQHGLPRDSYDASALRDRYPEPKPPPFTHDDHLLYSNIDDEQGYSEPPRAQPQSQSRLPPSGGGGRQDVRGSRDSDAGPAHVSSSSSPATKKDNRIQVSVEYPDGLHRHKPPVSIRIGGDPDQENDLEQGTGRGRLRDSGGHSWSLGSITQTGGK